jgi:hypothetical protein
LQEQTGATESAQLQPQQLSPPGSMAITNPDSSVKPPVPCTPKFAIEQAPHAQIGTPRVGDAIASSHVAAGSVAGAAAAGVLRALPARGANAATGNASSCDQAGAGANTEERHTLNAESVAQPPGAESWLDDDVIMIDSDVKICSTWRALRQEQWRCTPAELGLLPYANQWQE